MGSIDEDAFEAERRLRPQCLETSAPAKQRVLEIHCQNHGNKDASYIDKDFVSSISHAMTRNYFQDYASDVLFSELELASDRPVEPPQCPSLPDPRSRPHLQNRESAQSKLNLVSAGILSEIYEGLLLGIGAHHPYQERLEESFPMLFHSEEKRDELMEAVKQGLGEDFDYTLNDGRSHSSIKQAFETLYANSENFKKKIDDKVQDMSRSYAQSLSRDLRQLCQADPLELREQHPGIFKQAILDMDDKQRDLANNYLCSISEYYDPEEHDSDCDGQPDQDDPAPHDPYSPETEFSYSGRDMTNPPFSSSYDYDISYNSSQKKIKLETTLKFDTEELPPGKESREFIQKINSCKTELEDSLSEQFKSLKASSNSYDQDAQLETSINIEYDDFYFPDVSLHKCYCSDCKNKVIDPDNPGLIFDNYIDHRTCWDDLSENQKKAVREVFPNGDFRWRNRDNAANYTQNASCKTVKHELLHSFGLPDEYIDEVNYPYSRIGCNIMGIGLTEEIESRQIEAIIRPKECE